MSVRGWLQNEILFPRGAWSARALLSKNSPNRANIAQNVRFFPPYVYSREGTSNIVIGAFNTTAGKVGGMFNWIAPANNFLIYQDGTSFKRLDLSTGTVTTLGSAGASARYPTIADLGPRVYMASADVNGNGQVLPLVHDGASATDTCFRGPLNAITANSATDGGGGGLCTIGTHRLGFLYTNRNGFTGQPNPTTGPPYVFAYATVTLSAGLHHISYHIQFSDPGDGGPNAFLTPIMTRADNLNNWFILPPGAYSGVTTVNGAYNQTLTIDISDEDLSQQTSALPYFDYLVTNGVNTDAPPTPDFIVPYGARMCYGSGNTLYVSEIDNPQAITADLNVVPNPRQRRFKAAFPLGQELFVGGDKWTGRLRDNGDSPATWPQPSSVSESKGPAFPNCVNYDTLGGYAWIATEFGLEYFQGAYQDRPITYLVQDLWKTINWNAAYAIQIANDITNLKVYVIVPTGVSTEPNKVFVIDYTNGTTWDTVDISFDNYSLNGATTFSSIRSVKEAATNNTSIWFGPSAAGPMVHVDSTVHQDAGAAVIHSIWESGYCRRSNDVDSRMVRVGNVMVWAEGGGNLLVTLYNNDRTISVQPSLITSGAVAGQIPLSSASGKEFLMKVDLAHVENFSVRFEVNSLGDWFQLPGFIPYYRRDLANR